MNIKTIIAVLFMFMLPVVLGVYHDDYELSSIKTEYLSKGGIVYSVNRMDLSDLSIVFLSNNQDGLLHSCFSNEPFFYECISSIGEQFAGSSVKSLSSWNKSRGLHKWNRIDVLFGDIEE